MTVVGTDKVRSQPRDSGEDGQGKGSMLHRITITISGAMLPMPALLEGQCAFKGEASDLRKLAQQSMDGWREGWGHDSTY